jgi:hypothetical protein
MTLLRVGLVLAVAVAAAVVANVVLLGVATGSSEPVGKLSPNAVLVAPASPALPAPTTPAQPVQPSHGHGSGEHESDD